MFSHIDGRIKCVCVSPLREDIWKPCLVSQRFLTCTFALNRFSTNSHCFNITAFLSPVSPLVNHQGKDSLGDTQHTPPFSGLRSSASGPLLMLLSFNDPHFLYSPSPTASRYFVLWPPLYYQITAVSVPFWHFQSFNSTVRIFVLTSCCKQTSKQLVWFLSSEWIIPTSFLLVLSAFLGLCYSVGCRHFGTGHSFGLYLNIQLHWAFPLGFSMKTCIHFIVSITNQICVAITQIKFRVKRE